MNVPIDGVVAIGWVYQEGQFKEVTEITYNPETGELILPSRISKEEFWMVFEENILLKSQLQTQQDITYGAIAELTMMIGGATNV